MLSDTYLKLTWEGTSEAIVPIKETFEKYIRNPSNNAPSNLGTTFAGTSDLYSRSDHVHKLPTITDIGALPISGGDTTGNLYVGAGTGQKSLGVKYQDADGTSGILYLFNNTTTEYRGLYDSKNGVIIAISQDGSDIHFNGDISGNAYTATKLKTPRTITLSGDATGSANFDGSANINIDVSVPSSASWSGGNINNSATILADGASDLKYWGIQYIDDTGATQHFRMNASNDSDYLSLTSSDSRIGTILSVKYDGTSNLFYGSVTNANTLTLRQSNIYTTTSATAGNYGLALKNSDIIGANAVIFADECEANTEGILFPKQDITSGVGVARSASDFYTLRGYRGNLYFDGDIVITSSDIAQTKSGNFYVLLANGSSGQRNLGVQFYKDNTLTQLYLMYNSSTNYSALYHSEYGSVISIDEETGAMNFNGSAESAWKLSTNRTISLTGDATGSTSFDGGANVSISVDVNNSTKLNGQTAAYYLNYNNLSNRPTIPTAYTGTPAALGTASAGTSTQWARGNHVHAMPTKAQIGLGNVPNTSFSSGNGWFQIGSYKMAYGTFNTGSYSASNVVGYNVYGDKSVSVSFPISFSSVAALVMSSLDDTTGVLNVEPLAFTASGIQSVRIHRGNTVTNVEGFRVSYIVCGY